MRLSNLISLATALIISGILGGCAKQPGATEPFGVGSRGEQPVTVEQFDWDAVPVQFDEKQIQADFDAEHRIKLRKTLALKTDSSGPIVEFLRFLKIRKSLIYAYDKYLGQVLVFDLEGNYLTSTLPVDVNSKELIMDMDVSTEEKILLISSNDLFYFNGTKPFERRSFSGQGCVLQDRLLTVNSPDELAKGDALVVEFTTSGDIINTYGSYNFSDKDSGENKYTFHLWEAAAKLYIWNNDLPEIAIIDTTTSEQSLIRLKNPIFQKRGMFNTDTYTGSDTTLGIFAIFADIEVHDGRIFALIENDEIMMIAEIAENGTFAQLYTYPIASRESVLDFAVDLSRAKPSFWVIIGSPMLMNVYRFEQ